MYRLVLPFVSGFTKTIKARPHSHAINAASELDTSVTGNFMPVTLSGSSRLSDLEFSACQEILKKAGNTPVFMQDPLDNKANAFKEYDGLGGWTQGVYIPGYNQYSGFFAKLYGLEVPDSTTNPSPLYLRPIANAFNITYYNAAGASFPATWNPLTQVALLNNTANGSINTTIFHAGFGPSHPTLEGNRHVYPATFEFEQAYTITKFDTDLDGRSGAFLSGCGTQREISFEAREAYWNTRACWTKLQVKDTVRFTTSFSNF
jgi:hypothetical protein